MTAPSHLGLAARPVSRRRLRRLSRQFAGVGVEVSPARLRQIAVGHPVCEAERFDIAFAEAAIRIRDDQRHGKQARIRQRFTRSVIVAVATLLALNVLVCLGLAFFMLAEHTSPF